MQSIFAGGINDTDAAGKFTVVYKSPVFKHQVSDVSRGVPQGACTREEHHCRVAHHGYSQR